jgi:hypothetical protein
MTRPGLSSAFGALLVAIAASAGMPAAAQEPVDLELVLATDVSYSIDAEEARLQRQGTVAAFRSREIIRAIQTGALGRIAVAYMDFSGRPYNRIVIDWQVIHDEASALAFADRLATAPPTRGQSTSISDAVEDAAHMIDSNGFEGIRRVIDVSGDGPNNAGRLVDRVRDETLAKGITINGLTIINQADRWSTSYFLEDLDRYYEGCVIGGPGAFVIVASDFQDYARAIRQKLILEIAGLTPRRAARGSSPVLRAAAPGGVTLAQAAPPAFPPYEKGCDIGERMRRGAWGNWRPSFEP